jgi:hypothetical protein
MWALCLNGGGPVRGIQSSGAREGTRMTAQSDRAATKHLGNPLADEPRTRRASELARAIAAKYERVRRRLRQAGNGEAGKSGDAGSIEAQIRAAADRYESDIRAAGERYDAAMSRILTGDRREPRGERDRSDPEPELTPWPGR